MDHFQLVGALEYVYFPFHIWDVILPIDFHIFRGVQTTNQSGMEHRKDHLNAHLETL